MSKLGLVGSVTLFDDTTDDFSLYIEQLEQYFVANDIEKGKQVAVLLSVIGKKTYKLLRNLVMPKLPSACTYDELISALKVHFKPAPIIVAERFRFHRRNQHAGEKIADYIVELRRLASTCEFGAFLDEALRDRFVCGIADESTQKRLLAKKDLKLSEATEIALAMEIANTDASNMKMLTPMISKVQKSKVSKNTYKDHKSKCFRCGANHDPQSCKYKTAKCNFCSKTGHIAPVCMAKNKQKHGSTNKVEISDESENFHLFSMKSSNQVTHKSQYVVNVSIDGIAVEMELDTAADISVMSEWWVNQNLPTLKIFPTSMILKDYNQSAIEVVGEATVHVKYEKQEYELPLIVVKGNRPALFGKNWISNIKLNWRKIFSVKEVSIEQVKSNYADLFSSSSLPIKEFKASLKLQKSADPIFCKARPVPYSLKKAVSDEIKQSEQRGVWHFVEHSKWATPLVVVPKKNGAVRLCGDFKVTVNKVLDPNQYPLPTQQDLFATLRGGKYFTKLDLSHAYQQIELDSQSQELLTLNTHMGLVRPTRLLYGITSASAIFQSVMEQILQGFTSVICFQDDILISSATEADHFVILNKVLEQFRKYNVHLNAEKCKFMETSVEFLGHIIDEFGIHPTEEKVEAIKKIKAPVNVTELKSFLGLLNYYAKFIRNASTLLAPLHQLLVKDVPWTWSKQCNDTFLECKSLLTSESVLVHYDESLPLQLSCDASPVGLGVVLSHIVNGDEHPVAYASRTLTKAESGYSQTEKEALSIIYGCKKFHQYLYGRKFVLVTDHQPLVTIFAPDKSVPAMSAARLQRWALLLSSFKYVIRYKKGSLHQNADSLSRLPVEDENKDMYPSDIFKISYLEDMPLTSVEIAQATRTDKILGVVLKYVQYGFPKSTQDPELRPFFTRKDELSCDSNCLLWGMRVVIPQVHRSRMLNLLHETHPGTSKMKAIARSHIWWPKLDFDIEQVSAKCVACQKTSKDPPASTLQPWYWPKAPWHRIHIDFCQKSQNNFLIIVDSYSKWMEVCKMTSITALSTIAVLRQLFARYGYPIEVVSDNGPQFIADEFTQYLKSVGIKPTLIPTYHPQSNGQAERSVQTFKSALNKMLADAGDNSSLIDKINRFLLMYRSSPHSTTGKSPAELFLGRTIRTVLNLVHPCTSQHVHDKQELQKRYFDRAHSSNRVFEPGQSVWVRSHRDPENKWVTGTLVKQKGNRTWVVEISNKLFLAHVDQLRSCALNDPCSVIPDIDEPLEITPSESTTAVPCANNNIELSSETSVPEVSETPSSAVPDIPLPSPEESLTARESSETSTGELPVAVRRNPIRIRKKPNRLDL